MSDDSLNCAWTREVGAVTINVILLMPSLVQFEFVHMNIFGFSDTDDLVRVVKIVLIDWYAMVAVEA